MTYSTDPKDWNVHVVVPWARAETVAAPLSSAQKDYLADGTMVVAEWELDAIESLKEAFEEIGVGSVTWHRVFLNEQEKLVAEIPRDDPNVVIFNMVDGLETDGWPGASVVKAYEQAGLAFTGANFKFFDLDNNKTAMKAALTAKNAATPKFLDLSKEPEDPAATIAKINAMRLPVIVKPSPSASSRGITGNSVLYDGAKVLTLARALREEFGGAYCEEFVTGREFTCMISGSEETGLTTYKAVERVFNQKIKESDRYLSFEMKWDNWDEETANKVANEQFVEEEKAKINPQETSAAWWNALAPEEEQAAIQKAVYDVYCAVNGNGYARMDLRMDSQSRIYVLDVNCNCNIDYKNPSWTMGMALRGSNVPFSAFVQDLLEFGFKRRQTLFNQKERRDSRMECEDYTLGKLGQKTDSKSSNVDVSTNPLTV